MLKSNNQTERLAALRLLELCDANLPWHRSLWGIGIELALQELIEAADAMQIGTLSDVSVKRLAKSIQRMAGADPTLTTQEKTILNERLKDVPRQNGEAYSAICQLARSIGSNYLSRWGVVVRSGTQYSPERMAKCVATHLLDKGFSSAYVHARLREVIISSPQENTLAELCDELQSLERANPSREWRALVAFEHPPRHPGGFPPGWVRSDQIARWLKERGHSTRGLRPSGGFVWTVIARDAQGAAESARDLLDRYSARLSIATGKGIHALPFIWVEGADEALPIQKGSRGVRVEELFRSGTVFAEPSDVVSESVDAAFELLAHLEQSSPTAAIAGGWAAVEGLLGEPGNRSVAADHLASLVACSIPRAELTTLSYKVEKVAPGVLAGELAACPTNKQRAIRLVKAIVAKEPLGISHGADEAAIRRMAVLVAAPNRELITAKDLVADAFHRLYRQRNLILHGGMTSSVALSGSLRTVSKLVGAGMDRIAHGLYVNRLKPMELVARANIAIALADTKPPEHCAELLDY